MILTVDQILRATGGKLAAGDGGATVSSISTDTRTGRRLPGGVTTLSAISGSDQSGITASSRPSARSAQTRNSGWTASPRPARSAGVSASALLARIGPVGVTAASSPETCTNVQRSGVGRYV